MAATNKEESKRVLNRIRELLPIYGTNQTARMVGRHPATVSNIKTGRRGKSPPLTIDSLGLRRSTKLCRRCGNEAIIATKRHQCVTCELLELVKQGLITIESEESSNGG